MMEKFRKILGQGNVNVDVCHQDEQEEQLKIS